MIGFILKLVDLSVYRGVYVYMGVQVPMQSQRDAGSFYPAPLCLFVLRACLFSEHEAHQFGHAGGLVGTRDCPPNNLQIPSPPGIFWWQGLKIVPVHWRPLASTFFFVLPGWAVVSCGSHAKQNWETVMWRKAEQILIG